MTPLFRLFRSTVEVPCTVEIEKTAEFMFAHAIPEGIEIRPGDSVIVHGAPTDVPFGESITVQCRATVIRAGWLERLWTRWTGVFGVTDLYEVGFMSKEELKR
jgi:hypothetical protein